MTSQNPSPHAAIATRIIGNLVQAATPAVSPDGRWVAFVVARVDMDKNKTFTQIWLAAADGSTPPRAVSSGDFDANPTFSPDGSTLVFTSKRSTRKKDATVHALPVGGPGELRTLATMRDGAGSPVVSPDGRWVAFTSRTPDERYLVPGVDEGDESWQSPRRIDRFFTQLNGEGWVFDRPQHIYLVPLDGTAAPRNLTPGEFQHDQPSWAPDSRSVVCSARRHDTWDRDLAYDLYRIALDGDVERLTKGTGVYGYPSESPAGIAFLGHDDSEVDPKNTRVGLVGADGGEITWLTLDLDRSFQPTAGARAPVWSGDAVFATGEDRGEAHLFRVPLDGSGPQRVTDGAISVKGFDAAGGVTAYVASAVDELADVFVVSDGSPRRITDFADRYRTVVEPAGWERFAAPCTDGSDEVDAWIMRPVGFDPAKKYPVILNVHGGPHTQYGETYFEEAQFQAAAGFVVVMSNPRGSSGRHEGWGQAIAGPTHPKFPGSGWGGLDVDDLMSVLDTALERYPFCDRNRVGMQGGSYGGYMATTLASRFGDRFKAICSERAVNNLTTEEFTSDIATLFRIEHGPTHLEEPEVFAAMSPITRVRDIDCPMLIIHSEKDLRCPISQAEELFVALRLLGKDVTFYRFPGENHELSRSGSPVHRVQRAEIILDFFHHHLS